MVPPPGCCPNPLLPPGLLKIELLPFCGTCGGMPITPAFAPPFTGSFEGSQINSNCR